MCNYLVNYYFLSKYSQNLLGTQIFLPAIPAMAQYQISEERTQHKEIIPHIFKAIHEC